MKTLRFFTVPTLLGWLAAFLTCALIQFVSSVIHFGLPDRSAGLLAKDYALMLIVGGALIVTPTYFIATLPLSVADFLRGKFSGWMYAFALLFAGAAATALFAQLRLIDVVSAENQIVQMALFYVPFVPYAFVVAISAKRFFPGKNA